MTNMRYSESKEHRQLKGILKKRLMQWFKGIVLKEYMVAGYEADVYGITKDEIIVHAEVIWSPGQYGKNMISLLISDAHIKIAVFGPQTLKRFKREYDKIRLEQRKRGFPLPAAVDGTQLLNNNEVYFNALRRELVKIAEGMPETVPTFPRSYWFINEELVKGVAHSLGRSNWAKYPIIPEISLLDKNYTVDLEEVDDELGIRKSDWEPVYLDSLDWSKSKRLLRIFGRFNAPFGVKDETIAQFVLDPCYFTHKRPYSLNIHIQPKFIRSELESETLLGLDKWQKPSIFIIGLLKRFQPWQPSIIEPLVMYTSEEENSDFHRKLIEKTGRMERSETYFEDLSDEYGIEKAEKLEKIIDGELEKALLENCWENQTKAKELESLYGTVSEIVTDKNEVDALKKILGFSYMYNSLEAAEKAFKESKLQLIKLQNSYSGVLSSMLRELNPTFDLADLVSKETIFHDLVLRILRKSKINIQSKRKIQGFFAEVRVLLVLEGKSQNITLKIPEDELAFLEDLAERKAKK